MRSNERPIRATYRVQIHADFPFAQAAALAGYLADLGISHLYSSPYLQAAPGSRHGYDMVDPQRVNEEAGGAQGHALLCQSLADHGLGQVLDVVANHMAISGPENRWWWDVLQNGQASRYARYFDVDWRPPAWRTSNQVLLPVLPDHYGRVLEAGKIRAARDGHHLMLDYGGLHLPLAPRSAASLLARAAERTGSDDLAFLADAFAYLPRSSTSDPARRRRRLRDQQVMDRLLRRLLNEHPDLGTAIDEAIRELNEDVDGLDALISRQNYRIAYWKAASRDLGYRRFFDINDLVGLRVEDEGVFADVHGLALEWVRAGLLDGLRIDHPDGLREPRTYFERLRQAAPQAWIVGEKILMPGEELAPDWPIDGTTGYEFVNQVGGLFVDPFAEQPLTEFYREFTGESTDFPAIVREMKHRVMHQVLGSDVVRLTNLLLRIREGHRRYRDFTRFDINEAIREVIACFPVYRTYARAEAGEIPEADRARIERAVERATRERADIDPELLGFVSAILRLKIRGPLESEFVMRFQQVTGAAMAKGLEDCSFYVFNRFLMLNEVGGDPSRFGWSVPDFHAAMQAARERRPRTMLATSTHDTKRSEDVRARLAALSEMPAAWAGAVRRWSQRNERYREQGLPDRNAEYLFYQNLVGAWPISVERMTAYMEKAGREARRHTSWLNPDKEHEAIVRNFVMRVLGDDDFVRDLEEFLPPVIHAGRINSLAQALVKITAPGIPDFYQGTELWDLSLVDPDNRRPVDYGMRRRLLAELEGRSVEEILARMDEGLPKLWVIRQGLWTRRKMAPSFGELGSYAPLAVTGKRQFHVVAFARGDAVVTVVPRLSMIIGNDWDDTRVELPAGAWNNELTGQAFEGGRVSPGALFEKFPVALLTRKGERMSAATKRSSRSAANPRRKEQGQRRKAQPPKSGRGS